MFVAFTAGFQRALVSQSFHPVRFLAERLGKRREGPAHDVAHRGLIRRLPDEQLDLPPRPGGRTYRRR